MVKANDQLVCRQNRHGQEVVEIRSDAENSH